MDEKIKAKNYILIIIFAVVFGFVVQDGIGVVIQKFLKIPNDYIGLAQWGDTFFLRIFASLIGTATGAFIIGTFLKRKFRLSAIIATLPTVLFWIAVFIFGVTIISDEGSSFETVKAMLLLPGILAVLSPVVAYFVAGWGNEYFNEFQRKKSVLNIKWYHWLWILPFYLNKVVALPLFTLILLWKADWLHGGILYGRILVRSIFLIILAGLFASVSHVYILLSEEKTTAKINWKNGIIIFGHVLLFSVLYVLWFSSLW